MNEKLILLFLLLSFVKLSTVKHSEEIWQKFQQYSEEGQLLVESRDYFIFDESDYLSDVNNAKLTNLYRLQKDFYYKYGIKNYIFFIDYLGDETIESFTDDLFYFIDREFSPNMANSMITVIPIKDRLIRIQLGTKTNYKYDDRALDIIISNLGPYLRAGDFYGGVKELLNGFKYYYMRSFDYDDY